MRKIAVPLVLVLVAGGALLYAAAGGSDQHCAPPTGDQPKAVADQFVAALLADDGGKARAYLSSDAEALRSKMPLASGEPVSLRGVLRHARRSTIGRCAGGSLSVVGAPENDPCFIYGLRTTGGGWLQGEEIFPNGDFRVLLGCDGNTWRVKGTLRIDNAG
jgi:hypothetical protein